MIVEQIIICSRSNAHKMTKKEIDELLSSFPTLYFDNYTHKRMKFSDFVKKIFILNNSHSTCNSKTREIEEYGNNRRRSIVDIYRICKHYYPKTTNISLLAKIFYQFKEQYILKRNICSQVKRRVFMLAGYSEDTPAANLNYGCDINKDEFGLTFNEFLNLRNP